MHSREAAVAGAGELDVGLCARSELCRRKGLPDMTGIRSGVLREAPEQRSPSQLQAVTSCLLVVVKC